MHQVGEGEADHRLGEDRGDGEQATLEDHQAERAAAEQKGEVPQPHKLGHPLIQQAEVDRIQPRVNHQPDDQQDQRQAHQEGDGRAPAHQQAEAACLRPGDLVPGQGYGDPAIGHLVIPLSSRRGREDGPAALPARDGISRA